MAKQIALVTGANRGIGYEICRQLAQKGLRVILTSRDAAKGEAAAGKLKGQGLDVIFHPLDVTREESIQSAFQFISKNEGRLDALVNNAGILLDTDDEERGSSAMKADPRLVRDTFEINTLGPFRMCQVFAPLLAKNRSGRIVNLSSGMGQLSDMEGGYAAYRISKTALNAVTRIFAAELADSGILVNSACPGWVKTDMGGPDAELPVEEGADTPVWLATLPADGPTGGFFRRRKPIEW